MIVQCIRAGLGNQMFRYAFARALSLRERTPLYLDISYFCEKRLRDYGLDKLVLSPEVRLLQDHPFYNSLCALKKLFYLARVKLTGLHTDAPESIRKYAEKGFFYFTGRNYIDPVYNNKFINYYDGTFQSERYFSDYAKIVVAPEKWYNGLPQSVTFIFIWIHGLGSRLIQSKKDML